MIIGIVGTGDMGGAVGAMLARQGQRIVTDLSGRSDHSRELARAAGFEDLGSLAELVTTADVLLSIVPPALAFDFAKDVAGAVKAQAATPVFVDCNAVAPATVQAIALLFEPTQTPFLDVGIIGPAPKPATQSPTRFYVSGTSRACLLELDVPEIRMVDMGDEVGRGSAIKVTYAAVNKGFDALLTAALIAAERLGVRSELMREFEGSQPDAVARTVRRVPYLAATADRYAGEMREIAASFAAVGVTPDFHRGAEWLFAQLATSELANETRATVPTDRSVDEALKAFIAALPNG